MDSPFLSRRRWLAQTGLGFGAWVVLDLLEREARAATARNPLEPQTPHFPARAKAVIFLMMAGGPSQMKTFDPKPELDRLHGQHLPERFGSIPAQFTGSLFFSRAASSD